MEEGINKEVERRSEIQVVTESPCLDNREP